MLWPRPASDVASLGEVCNRCAKFAAVTRSGVAVILDRRQIAREAFQAHQLRVSATSNLAAMPALGAQEAASLALAFLTSNVTRDAKAETAKKRPVVPEDISQQVLKACSKIGAPERALTSFPNLRTLSAASLGELMAVDGIGGEKARKIRKVCSEN